MRLRLLFMVALLNWSSVAWTQKDNAFLSDHFNARSEEKERGFLKGGFTSKAKTKKSKQKGTFLPDFYAKVVQEVAERNQLPSFFNKALQREKERTLQPDFFKNGIFSKKGTMQSDHFKARVKKRDRGLQSDYFSSGAKSQERGLQKDYFGSKGTDSRGSDEELEMNARKKRLWRKNFIGERWRLFNTDPNPKQKRKKRRSSRKEDPFGKKARELDEPQAPRNQMDLFNGGVLPKMKDLR